MGTVVSLEIVGDKSRREAAAKNALEWFSTVERVCSRFDQNSELRALCRISGRPLTVSPMLLQLLRFALDVAHETEGAFDPAVGRQMEKRGFDRHYQTGEQVRWESQENDTRDHEADDNHRRPSYRDIELDIARHTVTLHRPMQIDLGAVAKGLAVDLAARQLSNFENFAIDAGGDLFLSGHNRRDEPWSVGIKHPRTVSRLLETILVTNTAVCTSGDYERIVGMESQALHRQHHILDPHTNTSPSEVASVTVVADSAMVADALGTAAFVLGPARGLDLLTKSGVNGCIVTPATELFSTDGWRALSCSFTAIKN